MRLLDLTWRVRCLGESDKVVGAVGESDKLSDKLASEMTWRVRQIGKHVGRQIGRLVGRHVRENTWRGRRVVGAVGE